jgi:alpha-glucoside transport system substrate-binding protein
MTTYETGGNEDEHCWEEALDGDLNDAVREHLATCASCSELVERMLGATMALQSEIPPPPPGLDVRVLATLERERHRLSGAGERPGLNGAGERPGLNGAGVRRGRAQFRVRRPVALALGAAGPRLAAIGAIAAVLLVAGLVIVRPGGLVTGGARAAVPITPLSAQCSGGNRIVVAGVWNGLEATEFAKTLGLFQEQTGIQVSYAYDTHSIATVLGSLIKSKCVPDVALLPQPGTMDGFVRSGQLQPLGPIVGDLVRRNYTPAWQQLGSVGGKLYGVWFKGAAKSMIWYRPAAFRAAGIARPPQTWAGLIADARKLRAVGIQPFAIGGADGWTLTDWFENIYLATAGPVRYQDLAENRIKWTDPSVKRALALLAEIFGDRSFSGPLSVSSKTTFAQSVDQVFGPHPRAAMVFEGDFVRSFLPASAVAGARFFNFPSPEPTADPAFEVGGDVAVLFTKRPGAERLIRFLATPAAAKIWVTAGGFISPNRELPLRDYPDPLSRTLAGRLVNASTIRFGLSDQEPTAFGSDPYQGMWLLFQQFLAHPGTIDKLTRELEAGATAAAACVQAVGGDC